MASPLLEPFDLGGLLLPNRIVLSPMTRGRVPATGIPDAFTATYYAQRATAGLLVSEGTCPAPGGMGTSGVPRIYEADHVAGWKTVLEQVHDHRGRMFMQLWHCGRVSLAEWQPGGGAPAGPSAIRAAGAKSRTREGLVREPELPRELSFAEIQDLIANFARAAVNARAAGCEGVEIHACNGYLIHQFFSERSNQRTDRYGGSIRNRIRFALEVAEAIAGEIGGQRTGIRISPLSTHQSALIDDPYPLFQQLIAELNQIGLVYAHCVEGDTVSQDEGLGAQDFDFRALRRSFNGAWIANNLFSKESASRLIAEGGTDLVSFGRLFIANPDLVRRFEEDADLNKVDLATVYLKADPQIGYTDYPFLPA